MRRVAARGSDAPIVRRGPRARHAALPRPRAPPYHCAMPTLHPPPAYPAEEPPVEGGRARLHEIIFEASTPAGRAFDVSLLLAIVLSVVLVSIETVAGYPAPVYRWLRVGE